MPESSTPAREPISGIRKNLDERTAETDVELHLHAYLWLIWEALQNYRKTEEDYRDRGLPCQTSTDKMVALISTGLEVADQLRKRLDSAVLRKKAEDTLSELGMSAGADDRFGKVLNDDAIKAAAKAAGLDPGAPNPYEALDAQQRLFLRSYTEKIIAICELEQQLKQSNESNQSASPPE